MSDLALPRRAARVVDETPFAKAAAIAVALAFLSLFFLAPLLVVITEASAKGFSAYWQALTEADALAAIALTVTIAAVVVPLNAGFGLTAAWAIAKFQFTGKNLLITLIDLPFSVSPVVSGLVFVLLF